VHVIYLWLPSPEFALARVEKRVASGGHGIPELDVRRRWRRSLVNLFDEYIPLATTWRVYDGSAERPTPVVARGGAVRDTIVRDQATWSLIATQADAIRRGEPMP
jgi:predicted ABC-type ATPase